MSSYKLLKKYKTIIGLSSFIAGTICYIGLDHTRLYGEAAIRALRCGYSGLKVINRYKRVLIINKNKYGINDESHEYAAEELFKCFTKNGGCYIKFGQVIAQVSFI